eukprot:3771814-Prymnesium_polylepis.2
MAAAGGPRDGVGEGAVPGHCCRAAAAVGGFRGGVVNDARVGMGMGMGMGLRATRGSIRQAALATRSARCCACLPRWRASGCRRGRRRRSAAPSQTSQRRAGARPGRRSCYA